MHGFRANAVTMFHVLEHLSLPVEGLVAVQQLLAPGGLLVLETPNLESWPSKLFRSRWCTLDAPRHLNLFSRDTLQRCVQQAGFRLLNLRTVSPSTIEYSESLRIMLRDLRICRYRYKMQNGLVKAEKQTHNRRAEPSHSALEGKALLHSVERIFYRLLNRIAERCGAGCNLLLVACK